MDDRGTRLAIATGLGLGAGLGLAGGMAPAGPAQETAWAISTAGLVLGTALLAARHARAGQDVIAAGFALLTMAECVIHAGGPITWPSGEASFAAATLAYVPALLLVSVPPGLPIGGRIAGGLAAVAFGIHALLASLGHAPSPIGPAANAGYAALTVACIAWSVGTLRAPALARAS